MPTHFRAGQEALRQGELTQAKEEFSKVLALDPDLVEARVNLGLAYHSLGEYNLAASNFPQPSVNAQIWRDLPSSWELITSNWALRKRRSRFSNRRCGWTLPTRRRAEHWPRATGCRKTTAERPMSTVNLAP